MEKLVIDELQGVLAQVEGSCSCEKCRQDMVAWALNRLPPKYVVTDLGYVYTNLNQIKVQARVDIVTKLTEAAQLVKEKPRH